MGPEQMADRVWEAVKSTTAISPLTDKTPELTIDTAYQIQDDIIKRYVAGGAAVTAAKLGLTSRAKQDQMNVTEPLYGWLTDEMQVTGSVEVDRFIQPRVEPEIAFVLARDIAGPDVTGSEVMAATESIAPALDILDSRFSGYRFKLADVVADNSSAAGYALGEAVEPPLDLRLTGCMFEKNEQLVSTAAGAAVMDHPASAIAWFARKLHERDGTLSAGMTVLAGAWTTAIPLEAGDTLRASFDRIGFVELEVT